jgi:hypothetical protein
MVVLFLSTATPLRAPAMEALRFGKHDSHDRALPLHPHPRRARAPAMEGVTLGAWR